MRMVMFCRNMFMFCPVKQIMHQNIFASAKIVSVRNCSAAWVGKTPILKRWLMHVAWEKYMNSIKMMTYSLTHWSRVTHICVSKVNIIGPDKGLSPGRRQAIIWTNAALLLIRNKLQWNLKLDYNILIKKNTFEDVFCEMVTIFFSA